MKELIFLKQIAPPSLFSLFIKSRFNGLATASGTAFVITSNGSHFLITNRHNVTGRHNETGECLDQKYSSVPNELEIFHHKHGVLGQRISKIEPLKNENDEPLWYEHPILGPRADFIALKLTELTDVALFPYEIPSQHRIQTGVTEVVSVVGYPFGLSVEAFPVWATGFIATDPDLNYKELPVMLIDCRSRQGQSGSPVLLYRGGGMVSLENNSIMSAGGPIWRFLGIYSGRINDESDLGVVWKESAILELINSID
jgi:hypothetical protein